MATVHDARQSFIQDELVEAIKSYNCVTYRQLAGHINYWCEHSCIMNWLHSHESYSLYPKNIKPGLTPENQQKQVAFSRRVQQRWGLEPGTKILWIHCDEKWSHGIVPRTNAKACPELGIAKTSHSAHHKMHIAKVMAHCCVGYLLTGDVEAGGDGFWSPAIGARVSKCRYATRIIHQGILRLGSYPSKAMLWRMLKMYPIS